MRGCFSNGSQKGANRLRRCSPSGRVSRSGGSAGTREGEDVRGQPPYPVPKVRHLWRLQHIELLEPGRRVEPLEQPFPPIPRPRPGPSSGPAMYPSSDVVICATTLPIVVILVHRVRDDLGAEFGAGSGRLCHYLPCRYRAALPILELFIAHSVGMRDYGAMGLSRRALLISPVVLAACRGPESRSTGLAITGVRVFDGERVTDADTVLVADGRITSVGKGLEIPSGMTVHAGQGGTLLPG